jgi:hypothetical protein
LLIWPVILSMRSAMSGWKFRGNTPPSRNRELEIDAILLKTCANRRLIQLMLYQLIYNPFDRTQEICRLEMLIG